MKYLAYLIVLVLICAGCGNRALTPAGPAQRTEGETVLKIEFAEATGKISVLRLGGEEPILVQNAQPEVRPYIHPIVAPDGSGLLTEYRPAHHRHQTGLYWGLKMVNGRDFFMNGFGDYYRKVSASVLEDKGPQVKWRTVYDLLDENGAPVLTETQTWAMRSHKDTYLLDLEWRGEAKKDITLGKFYVGGLFLRMPWREGMPGEVVNAVGQRNQEAEQQRAIWADIGLQVEGREDLAHIAILDHPANGAFPIAWRVDGELGVGPSRQILGDWEIKNGETEVVRYRLVVFTGDLRPAELNRAWRTFVCEQE